MDPKKKVHHIHTEDIAQLIFGALIFGVPAAYTQETWDLGAALPPISYFLLFLLSTILIALIVFHTGYHRHKIKLLEQLYIRRVLLSYMLIFFSCTVFLFLIGKAPWFTDPLLALQRTIIISVPASISGITADIIH